MNSFKKIIAGICALTTCMSTLPVSGALTYALEENMDASDAEIDENDIDISTAEAIDEAYEEEVTEGYIEDTTIPPEDPTEEFIEETTEIPEDPTDSEPDYITGQFGENAEYKFADGVLIVSGTGEISDTDISFGEAVTSLVIEEGITSIADGCFNCRDYFGDYAFKTVSLPSTLTSIGKNVFAGMTNAEFTIAEDNDTYSFSDGFLLSADGTMVYEYWGSENKMVIPQTVTSIPDNAFSTISTDVEEIDITENVEKIGENAFNVSEYSVQKITFRNAACEIPDSFPFLREITVVGYEDSTAHAYCVDNNIRFINIETGVISGKCGETAEYTIDNEILTISGSGAIENYAFSSDKSFTSIVIEEGITSIGVGAFEYTSAQRVTLPESLETIGNYAFYYSEINNNVVIPAAVSEIGESAFVGCYLSSVEFMNSETVFPEDYRAFETNTMIIGYADSTAQKYAFAYGNEFKDIETGEIITCGMCGENAQYMIKNNFLTITGEGEIYENSFSDNTSITGILIDEGITKIGRKAFSGCENVKSISISSTVSDIDVTALMSLNSLEEFSVSESSPYYSAEGGYLLNADKTKLVRCMIYDLTDEIPATVTEIGELAFADCQDIISIDLPENIAKINNAAFLGCPYLESVTIHNKKCEIYDARSTFCNEYYEDRNYIYNDETDEYEIEYYYYNCNYSGTICGYNDSTAKKYAFNYGLLFKDIETGEITQTGKCGENLVYSIKNGIITISGEGEMYNSPEFGSSTLTDAIIEEGVESLGDYAFSYCNNLRAVSLPSTLKSIGDRAFYNCYYLDSIILPESLETIGSYAFYNCDYLYSIELPEGLKKIGSDAFYDCDGLQEVVVPKTVTEIGGSAFSSMSRLNRIRIENPKCEISGALGGRNTIIEGYADSTAFESAYRYGRKFLNIETGELSQTGKCGDNLTYSINSGVLTISGTGAMYDDPLFKGDDSIYEVVIGDGVTSIGDYAFNDCDGIASITISAGITTIGYNAFGYCSRLEDIYVDEANEYFSSVNGVLYSKDKTAVVAYPYGRSAENYTVPSTVNEIESNAFCPYSLKMVTIENPDCVIGYGISSDITICGYSGSTAEDYAYDNNRYFRDIETGITTLKGRCGDDLIYSMTMSGDLTVSGTGEMYSNAFYNNDVVKNVTIKSGATSIGSYAFYSCGNLQSISIPSTVTRIGSYAFAYCGLKSISVPASVKSIGNEAFYNSSLTEITLAEGLESIESYAFEYSKLKEITLPASLKELGGYAFSGSAIEAVNVSEKNGTFSSVDGVLYDKAKKTLIYCPEDKPSEELTLPSTVNSIQSNAFYNNYTLKKVTIPNGECKIYDSRDTIPSRVVIYGKKNSTAQKYAYKYGKKFCVIGTDKIIQQGACGDKLTYDITDGVLTITGTGAMYDEPLFSGSSDFTKAVIGEGVTSVSKNAFNYCSDLVEISIPSTVTSIGEKAFYNCNSLKTVSLSENIKTIGDLAFNNCSSLESIDVAAKNPNYSSVDGVLFDKPVKELICYPENKSGEEYTVPASVTSIGDYAFYDCSNLKNVILPEGLESIGFYAFDHSNLQSINFPSTLKSIGNSAFRDCYYLSGDIVIPEGITSIGDSVFYYCDDIVSVVLPESVKLIANKAFCGCDDMQLLTIKNPSCKIFNEKETIYSRIVICGYADSTAYNYAFNFARKFKDIETNEIVQKGKCGPNLTYEIKDGNLRIYGTGEMYNNPAFSGNDEITSVTIEKGVTSIGAYAFEGCDYIEEIVLPDGIANIGNSAFRYCNRLSKITIPESVVRIGESAFESCSDLKEIKLPSGLKELSSRMFSECGSLETVEIPDGIKKISSGAFSYCRSLKSVTIPESVTKIDSSAFSNCSALEEIKLPSTLTTIGNSAFYNCSSLKSMSIPASVTEIGTNAFGYCSLLESIDADGNANYATVDGILYNSDKSTIIAYPAGKKGSSFTVPSTVKTIAGGAISGNKLITEIIIGKNVTLIENNAISNCSNLENVKIDNPNCTIGSSSDDYYSSYAIYTKKITGHSGSTAEKYAYNADIIFSNIETGETYLKGSCGEKAEYVLQDGVLTISGSGYVSKYFESGSYKYETIKKVVVGKDITELNNSLSYHNNIESFEINSANENMCSVNGVVYSKDMKTLCYYPRNKKDKSFAIPDSVERVYAIYSKNLEKLTIGANTSFKYTSENGDGSIDTWYSCEIYCQSLKEIAVSAKNKTCKVKDNILYNSELTTMMLIPEKISGAVDIPDSVEYYHQYFSNKPLLTSVKLPKSLKYIWEHMFYGDSSLKEVILPDKLEYIGYSAMAGTGIEEFVVPETVEYIGSWAFANCENMKKLTILNPNAQIGEFEYEYDEEAYDTPPEDRSFSVVNKSCSFGKYDEETGEYIENVQYNIDGIVICGLKGSSAERFAKKWGYKFEVYGESQKTELKVNRKYVSLEPGQSFTITANIAGVTFTSSNPKVASVNSKGVVTALGSGKVNITVKDPSGQKVVVEITVQAAPIVKTILLGDVNFDESIDAKDASLILSAYAKKATGQDMELTVDQIEAADVNVDTLVDSKDASLVLSYYAYTATGGKDDFTSFMKK